MRRVALFPDGGVLRIPACPRCRLVWLTSLVLADIRNRAGPKTWREARGVELLNPSLSQTDPLSWLAAWKQIPIPEGGFKWGYATAALSLLLLISGAYGIQNPRWALVKLSFVTDYAFGSRLHTWLTSALVHVD